MGIPLATRPHPCTSAAWLYTHKIKAKLRYICPNTEYHTCLRRKGNQSPCGEYPLHPFSSSSTPESTLLMNHQRWKKTQHWELDSQKPFLVSAFDPGCCLCPKPTAFPLEQKKLLLVLAQGSLLFLLGRVRQKDHPAPTDEFTPSQEVALTCTHCSDTQRTKGDVLARLILTLCTLLGFSSQA